jgi:hypothetical protein
VVNAHRFEPHAPAADTPELRELCRQAGAAEYALRAHQVTGFFIPERRGYDLLSAAALLPQATPLGRVRTASGRRRGRATTLMAERGVP